MNGIRHLFFNSLLHLIYWKSTCSFVNISPYELALFVYRFDIFGIYVVMFLEILRTLLQVLCVFSILLIAFGMAFFVLMNKEVVCLYKFNINMNI